MHSATASRAPVALLLTALLGGAALLGVRAAGRASIDAPAEGGPERSARARLSLLPLSFEENRGQSDPEVRFLSRGTRGTLLLTPTEAVLSLPQAQRPAAGARDRRPLRMRLVGGNRRPKVSGGDRLPARVNYFIGNDREKWRTDVPLYRRVKYEAVYPGVDLVYHGDQGELEYDFVVAPGADPGRIRLSYDGADRLEVDARGDLLLLTGETTVCQRRPTVYQEIDGRRVEIPGRYRLIASGPAARDSLAFDLGSYDASRPLVIDPVLSYSTFLGGFSGEGANDVAVDPTGRYAYVTGIVNGPGLATVNGYQSAHQGGAQDAFVAKLDTTASGAASLLYLTYLGGTGLDIGRGIAADSAGNAYVAGDTHSGNFPNQGPPSAPGQPFQSTSGGIVNAFVTRLDTNASGAASLLYSTFLGGSASWGADIVVGAPGVVYVAGTTEAGFPVTPATAYRPNYQGLGDAFVTKLDTAVAGQAALLYSTYFGGSQGDEGLGVAVDRLDNAYITGRTNSTANFPVTPGAPYPNAPGNVDAYAAKLDTNAAGALSLVYSTYLGGSSFDVGRRIGVDGKGHAYVAGRTVSSDLPTVNELQGFQGGGDAFVIRLEQDSIGGVTVGYSTYLGGTAGDCANGIAVDPGGAVFVTGYTSSYNFPLVNAFQTTPVVPSVNSMVVHAGFVTKLDYLSGNPVSAGYSTYLTGIYGSWPEGIDVDLSGSACVAGGTCSTNFPVTSNAYQPVRAGSSYTVNYDAFVTRLLSELKNPTGLKVTAVSCTKLKIEWTDQANNEQGFEVYRFTNPPGPPAVLVHTITTPSPGVGATVSWTNTGLNPSTSYTYRVRAYSGAAFSAYTPYQARTPLRKPSNLTATPVNPGSSNTKVKLEWQDNSTTESGFRIQRSTNGGPYLTLVNVPANVTTYVNTGLTNNTTYKYRVRAYCTQALVLLFSDFSNVATISW